MKLASTRSAPDLSIISRRQWLWFAGILLPLAFLIRCSQFGYPLVQIDENFYLLVGDRMLQGALPYVDIWDRKPIGLFLIYAGIRLLGGSGIVEYQVVATLFAAGTAWLVARLAANMATVPAAALAGVLYLLLLGRAGGTGGQSPVFYSLFVAGAALATFHALIGASPAALRRSGCFAMALMGVAMQVKYTALFEGVFFGLALLYTGWRRGAGWPTLTLNAGLWAGIALLPTAAAAGYYAGRGELPAFVYANFVSIGERPPPLPVELWHRLGKLAVALGLPAGFALLTIWFGGWRDFARGRAAFGFTLAWLGAAVAGYLLFGTYHSHYALPLVVPLAAACAPLFAARRAPVGAVAAVVMLGAGAIAYAAAVRKIARHGTPAQVASIVATIRPLLGGSCLFVFSGDPILYFLTRSCIPTRFAFPRHLNMAEESGALGIDTAREVRNILATRPSVIVVDLSEDQRAVNRATTAIVAAELRTAYRPVRVTRMNGARTIIYRRLVSVTQSP